MPGRREKFCQLVAAGDTYTDVYLEAYQKAAGIRPKDGGRKKVRVLMSVTDIVLRVQELSGVTEVQKAPRIWIAESIRACQVARDLAYVMSHSFVTTPPEFGRIFSIRKMRLG